MLYKTDKTNENVEKSRLIPPHGGYKKLLSYQMATIVYDLTVEFCKRYMSYRTNKTYTRTYDQMVQAARSGKQNIAEGSQASGTSKKTELKLVGIARASLAELLADYIDFLRQRGLAQWEKDSLKARKVRGLAYRSDKSYRTYRAYISDAEIAANCLICLIHQTNYLLDRQIKALGNEFLREGGFTERLYRERKRQRGFTLIEIILAVSISSILLWQGLVKYNDFNRKQQVKQAGLDFVSELRSAQNRAITGKQPAVCNPFEGYRVSWNRGANSYRIGPVCAGAPSFISYTLKSNLVRFSSSGSVLFAPLYGTSSGAAIAIQHIVPGVSTATVAVEQGGSIECAGCE